MGPGDTVGLSDTAAAALALAHASRSWLADRAIAPWWYNPMFGALNGGLIAIAACSQHLVVRLVGRRLHVCVRCSHVVEPTPRGRVDRTSSRLGEHGLYWATPSPGRCGRPRLLARLGPGADLGLLCRWGIGPSPDGGFRQSNRRRPAGQARGAALTAAPDFNDLVHTPNRLRICALLAAVSSAEFSTVREALGVADSVLSKHVAVLHDAGYVEVHKSTCASRVRTSLSLTAPAGSPTRAT